jgi:hypothetical protein
MSRRRGYDLSKARVPGSCPVVTPVSDDYCIKRRATVRNRLNIQDLTYIQITRGIPYAAGLCVGEGRLKLRRELVFHEEELHAATQSLYF